SAMTAPPMVLKLYRELPEASVRRYAPGADGSSCAYTLSEGVREAQGSCVPRAVPRALEGPWDETRCGSRKLDLRHAGRRAEGLHAGERHLLVLVDAVSAYPDAAHELAALVERHATRESDQAVPRLLTARDADLVRVPDSPQRLGGTGPRLGIVGLR